MMFEVMLLAAIPLLGVIGFETLLDSKAGTFVEQPGPGDPGWQAYVDPSPVTLVVEVLHERVTGAVVIAQPGSSESGGVLLTLPSDLTIDGVALASMRPAEVTAAVASALSLSIPATEIMDVDRWRSVLEAQTVRVDNPDPIPSDAGETMLPIGLVDLSAADVPVFLGRPASEGPPEAIVVRRHALWRALLDNPPMSSDSMAGLLRAVADGPFDVAAMPTALTSTGFQIVGDEAEAIVNEFVPFPAGAEPGDRLAVHVLRRNPDVDVQAAAQLVGGLGYEVVLVGNAAAFDEGGTAVVIPIGGDAVGAIELIERFDADTVNPSDETDSPAVITLLLGTTPPSIDDATSEDPSS